MARQKRIDVDGDNFYIGLVFYNYVLKCFVLIDLKLDKLTHQDIGQMDFYVRYYDNEIKAEEIAKKENIRRVWLFSGFYRKGAHELYRKLGYDENRDKAFVKNIEERKN